MRRVASSLAFVCALFMAGCTSVASGSDDGATWPHAQPVAVPSGDVVLTVADDGVLTEFDVQALEALGAQSIVVDDPFVNRSLSLDAVPLVVVLAAAGIGPDDALTWRALDNYEVYFTGAELLDDRAWLAIRQDNDLIDIADGGPVRVVFTNLDGPLGRDTNQWIWSLDRIEVNSR